MSYYNLRTNIFGADQAYFHTG